MSLRSGVWSPVASHLLDKLFSIRAVWGHLVSVVHAGGGKGLLRGRGLAHLTLHAHRRARGRPPRGRLVDVLYILIVIHPARGARGVALIARKVPRTLHRIIMRTVSVKSTTTSVSRATVRYAGAF